MNIIEDEYFLKFTKLNEYPELGHFSTKRPFSLVYNDSLEDKNKKVAFLQDKIDSPFDKYILAKQEHTTKVVKVTEENINDSFIGVDGLITNLKGVALFITTADCQPILVYDPVKKVIANVHSGWKGTLNKIIVNAIKMMESAYDCNPQDMIVCIAPSIQKCCFEVDEDVMMQFKNSFDDINEDIVKGEIKDGKQKYLIDTININRKVLLKLGLKDENIIDCQICTKHYHDTYHSFRAKDLGFEKDRNITAIWLKNE